MYVVASQKSQTVLLPHAQFAPFPRSRSGSPKLRCMLAECSTAQACCVNCLVIVDWSQTPDPEQHMDMGDRQAGVQMVQAMMLLWYDAIAQPGEARQSVETPARL